MIIEFKKIFTAFTITLLLFFQVANIQAIEIPSAPTPPSEPSLVAAEAQITPPTPPEAPTLESILEPEDLEADSVQEENLENIQELDTQQPDLEELNLPQAESSGEENINTALQNPSFQLENSGNGSGSIDSNTLNSEPDTTTQDNGANVTSGLNLDTTKGQSSASANVGNSVINTGDANTSGTLITAANANLEGLSISEFNIADDKIGDLILDLPSSCIFGCNNLEDLTLTNSGNGTNSRNTNEVTEPVSNETFQNNETTVENNMTLSADSGYNQADKNTGGDSNIETGDANVSANVLNFLNSNLAGQVLIGVVNIFGDLIGDIILPENAVSCTNCNGELSLTNTGNGADSVNAISLDKVENSDISQFNTADITNNMQFLANTGGNTANYNTGGSSTIQTGEASVEGSILNIVNSNISGGDLWLVIVNQAGEWAGQILGTPTGTDTISNLGNGSNSQNTNTTEQITGNNTNQTNNAQIINNLNLSADTGNNSTSYNTGGNNLIKTGDAVVIANLINFINTNIASFGRLRIVAINVFGSWIGDFISPGQKTDNDNHLPDVNEESLQGNTGGEVGQPEVNLISQVNQDNIQTAAPIESLKPESFNFYEKVSQTYHNEDSENEDSEADVSIYANELPNRVLGTKTQQEKPLEKTIDINLAWLLLIFPLLAVSFKLAQKYRRF